jgi:hypothetical protein
MGKGLLAWWRRRMVSRGLAGAALFAVPVAVAALIGFGTSLSEVAGGLTAVTSGPDAVPAAAQAAPSKLNHAVVALANRPARSAAQNRDQGSSGGQATSPGNGVSVDNGTGAGTGSGSGGGDTGATAEVAPADAAAQVAPGVSVPESGGVTTTTTTTTTNAVNQVNGAVNDLLGGVGQTLQTLLDGGRGQ